MRWLRLIVVSLLLLGIASASRAQLGLVYSTLDAFGGASTLCSQGGWGDNVDTDDGVPTQGSGTLNATGTGGRSCQWTRNVFAPPMCLRLTLTDHTGQNNAEARVFFVASGQVAAPTAYRINLIEATGTDTFSIRRVNGGTTTVGTDVTGAEYNDGDIMTVCREGNGLIRRYINGTGVGTDPTDTTYYTPSIGIGFGGDAASPTLLVDNLEIGILLSRRR